MKDQKPFIIGLGLGVLIIAGIALSKPKQSKEATAPSTSKLSQAAAKPEPKPEPEPETPNKPAAPEPAEASVMALVDAVDEPAGKIRVLTGIALSHVKADKDAAPLLEALLQQLEALTDDAARREALADVNEEFAELADHEALTDFQAALVRELPTAAVEALAASRGWSLSSSTSRSLWLKRQGLVLQCCWGQFTTLLPAAQVVVSMAGTASEQAVGLGKPVLQLAGHGPQFTVGFAEAQRRLLGPAVHCVEGDVDDPNTLIESAEVLEQLLQLPEATLQQLREQGDQRLGQAGGTQRMARAILERLQQP